LVSAHYGRDFKHQRRRGSLRITEQLTVISEHFMFDNF
jgi:hypothetical protein